MVGLEKDPNSDSNYGFYWMLIVFTTGKIEKLLSQTIISQGPSVLSFLRSVTVTEDNSIFQHWNRETSEIWNS